MKSVGAAIAFEDKSVLVTKRAAGQNLAGFWEFPGGKVEPGESVQQCVERELLEELGLRVLANEVLAETTFEYPGGIINLIGVRVTILSGEIRLTVHDEFRWLEPRELKRLSLAPADIPLAEEVIRQYG